MFIFTHTAVDLEKQTLHGKRHFLRKFAPQLKLVIDGSKIGQAILELSVAMPLDILKISLWSSEIFNRMLQQIGRQGHSRNDSHPALEGLVAESSLFSPGWLKEEKRKVYGQLNYIGWNYYINQYYPNSLLPNHMQTKMFFLSLNVIKYSLKLQYTE